MKPTHKQFPARKGVLKKEAPPSPRPDPAVCHLMVERGIDDLRRNHPVVVRLGSNTEPVLALVAETLTDTMLQTAKRWSQTAPVLALSQKRASALALNVPDIPQEPLSRDSFPSPLVPLATMLALPPEISARDIQALADPTRPDAAGTYGHLPLASLPAIAGQAALCLSRMAGFMPAMLLFPLTVKAEQCLIWAQKNSLIVAEDRDIFAAFSQTPKMIQIVRTRLPIALCETAYLRAFRSENGRQEHYAIEIGTPDPRQPVLIRLHSQCFTGDVLDSLRCDCGHQLKTALRLMDEAGSGILLYLLQEGRGIGLASKLKAYQLQDHGFNTFEANQQLGYENDERNFAAAAGILEFLGITHIRLMTNNPCKVDALEARGLTVTERQPVLPEKNPHNAAYLDTKSHLGGHLF